MRIRGIKGVFSQSNLFFPFFDHCYNPYLLPGPLEMFEIDPKGLNRLSFRRTVIDGMELANELTLVSTGKAPGRGQHI